jgi:hypothetical protein
MRFDDPEPLKFTTIPTWQAFMSPLPAQIGDDAPQSDRAIQANAQLSLDTTSWLQERTRLGGIRLLRSPTLISRGDSRGWIQEYSGKEILVESWRGMNSSFSLWLGPEGRYPLTGYPVSAWPVGHDWTESVEPVHGMEMHLTSFRLIRRDGPPEYHVLAYWLVRTGMWASVAAQSSSKADQEHFIVMLRSAELLPQDEFSV